LAKFGGRREVGNYAATQDSGQDESSHRMVGIYWKITLWDVLGKSMKAGELARFRLVVGDKSRQHSSSAEGEWKAQACDNADFVNQLELKYYRTF